MARISTIEGIGESYASKLNASGVATVEKLLTVAGEKAGRRKLANDTGISEKLILKWVNMADLFRIHGVAGQYAELLECSGIDTVKELAQRNPNSLHEKMTAANIEKKVVRQVPALKIVKSWVTEAGTLPRKVSY